MKYYTESEKARRAIFALNLRTLLQKEGINQKEAAKRWGIDHARLRRWSTKGIATPYKAGSDDLDKLAVVAKCLPEDFWKKPIPLFDQVKSLNNEEAAAFLEKVCEYFGIQEKISRAQIIAAKMGHLAKPKKKVSAGMAKFLNKNKDNQLEAEKEKTKSIFDDDDLGLFDPKRSIFDDQ